jgi:hypothetical protein
MVRIVDVLPSLAVELEVLLAEASEPALAGQISNLNIVKRCSCNDDFCATFYTQQKPSVLRSKARHVVLKPQSGMIVVDVVSGCITGVEVLFRDEIQRALRRAFPKTA